MNPLAVIIKKEIRSVIREKAIGWLSMIILVLLVISLINGVLSFQQQQEKIVSKQEEKRREWLAQGDKHPHIAAHYGTFVFKPKTVLSLFDFGLEAYTGTSVYLEAHHRHDFMFRPAQDHTSMIRFGELSTAMVLQILLPLLIIFTGFSAFTSERENGTLRLMISQGVALSALIKGKIIARFLLIFTLLTPCIIFISLFSLGGVEQQEIQDLPIRTILLIFTYVVYLLIIISITVLVSLWSKSSRNALIILLIGWVAFTVIIPKTIVNLGENLYPLPSMREFKARIEADMNTGINGQNSRKEYYELIKTQYLKKYAVDSVEQLPVNYEGVRMQAGEDFGNSIHDHHLTDLRELFDLQNTISSYSGILNPFIAVRSLSMMLSGTDLQTTVSFEDSAEEYRRELVRKMNNDMAMNSAAGQFFEYKAGRSLWEDLSDFSYKIPSVISLSKMYMKEFGSLALWFILMLVAIQIAGKKTRKFHE